MSVAGGLARASRGRRRVRVRDSVPAIVQITVTAVAAYAFAYFVLGHDQPLIAAIVAITALGFVRDARPVRVLETVIAMTLGIVLAEVLLLAFGAGVLQYAVALALTLALARLVSANAGVRRRGRRAVHARHARARARRRTVRAHARRDRRRCVRARSRRRSSRATRTGRRCARVVDSSPSTSRCSSELAAALRTGRTDAAGGRRSRGLRAPSRSSRRGRPRSTRDSRSRASRRSCAGPASTSNASA